ncbi:MAG TPA: lipopolysaccharide biosynthesis protein [Saprospiraceae bacterium]|nr:lipopolysaccharide biosynthesis protein [Saprospiraceae bacterium]HMQ83738.1 lipopolysaccharide biosynthesis protein [Saprospiraceae bacterium]
MEKLKEKTLAAVAWDFVGKLAGELATFIIGIILARLLFPKEFGIIAIVIILINLLQVLIAGGFRSAIVRFQGITHIQLSTIFWYNLAVSIALMVGMYLSSGFLAAFFEIPDLKAVSQTVSVNFIFVGLSIIQEDLLIKELKVKLVTLRRLIASIIGGVVGIILAYQNYGVWSLVWQTIVGGAIGTVLIWTIADWKPGFIFQWSSLKEILPYSRQMFISNTINRLFDRLDGLFISKFFSPIILGLFNRAKSLNHFIIQLSSESLRRVLFPVFAKVDMNPERSKRILHRSLHLVSFICIGLTGWLFATSEEIVLGLLGPKWAEAVLYFQLFCIGAPSTPILQIITSQVKASGDSVSILRLTLIRRTLLVASLVASIYLGIFFLVIALGVISILSIYIILMLTRNKIPLTIAELGKITSIYTLIALVMAIPLWWFHDLGPGGELFQLIFKSIVFGAGFIGANWLLRTKAISEIIQLVQPILKKIKRKLR